MKFKLMALLGSIRFWILTLTAVLAILNRLVDGALDIQFVFKTAEVWLSAVVILGSLDSVAEKLGVALGRPRG